MSLRTLIMTQLLTVTLLFSGLCSLSSSVPRQFHVVKELKNWTEAQQYCREEFTDLATIDNMTEMEEVKRLMQESGGGNAWIGLKNGSSPKWQWSLADRDFYRENEAEFRNWDTGQPDRRGPYNYVNNVNCGRTGGTWSDSSCSFPIFFVCYNGGNSTQPYVLFKNHKTWMDAQRYCRENHTDLASVRNQAENDQIKQLIGSYSVWIGLFRDAWEWSDGSNSSFRHWGNADPNMEGVACTEAGSDGWWYDVPCGNRLRSICYGVPKEKRWQIVRVAFQVDAQVNTRDPVVQQAFLQQIQQKMKQSGMPADAKVTWRKKPDGQIFLEMEDNKEEGRRRMKRDEH